MTTTTDLPKAAPALQRLIAPRWDNWRGALAVFIIGTALAIALLAPKFSFWLSAALAVLFAAAPLAQAPAQDKTIELKLAHWVPASHPLHKGFE